VFRFLPEWFLQGVILVQCTINNKNKVILEWESEFSITGHVTRCPVVLPIIVKSLLYITYIYVNVYICEKLEKENNTCFFSLRRDRAKRLYLYIHIHVKERPLLWDTEFIFINTRRTEFKKIIGHFEENLMSFKITLYKS